MFEIEPPGLPEGGQTAVRFVDPLRPQTAPRLVLRCEVDPDGRIRELHTILNPHKLTAVRFGDPPPAAA